MTQNRNNFDVVVVGGGTSGFAAAVAASRAGARTLLVERFSCLGGASTNRSVVTYCGLYTLEDKPRLAVRGVAEEVTGRLKTLGAITEPVRHRGVFVAFEPEAVKRVLDEIAREAGVTILLGAMVVGAERAGTRVHSVRVASHAGIVEVQGNVFVDCTGEGDLAFFAGAGTRYGNGKAANLGTLATRFGGIEPDTVVSADEVCRAIKAIDPDGIRTTKDRSVIVRLPISGDLVCYLASEGYTPLDPFSMSAAEARGRQQAWVYLEAIRRLPGCNRAYLVNTGPEFGTRESRHVECISQLAWESVQKRVSFEDCIALGAWGAEWHDRATFASSFDYPPEKKVFEIPLSCLRSNNTTNLFCGGRLADGDRKASAAIRVMGTSFATGQAAGVAAAFEAAGVWSVQEVQKTLRREGAILNSGEIK